jgi:excisionase family DNA binding protein
LSNDRKQIKIITADEFKALFVRDWQKVWNDDQIACIGNKLAALTGMRISEVLGLRGEYVHDTHIFLCAQYDCYGYRKTKTKEKHNIPLVPKMIAGLRELMKKNGNGFLFSFDGGATPVTRRHLYDGLHKALRNIGISKNEIKERGLCIHAWRHFCNTELQRAGLTIPQVQAVTGHKSERMTEWYCHFDASAFGEVQKVQEELLNDDPPADTNRKIYLTVDELAQHIKMSTATIRRYVMNREIPFFRIKKDIRFRLSDIERWLETKRVPASG